MKGLMFNNKYGLEDSVLNGTKTMTRRNISNRVPYEVGEIVAIKQAYKDINIDVIPFAGKAKWGNPRGMAGWDNKMFVRNELMPHHVQITDVRLERLQDISNEDCIKEGLKDRMVYIGDGSYSQERRFYIDWKDSLGRDHDYSHFLPEVVFAELIDMISGKGTWENNNFVWAIEFKLID